MLTQLELQIGAHLRMFPGLGGVVCQRAGSYEERRLLDNEFKEENHAWDVVEMTKNIY